MQDIADLITAITPEEFNVKEPMEDLIEKARQINEVFVTRKPNKPAKANMLKTLSSTMEKLDPIFTILNTLVQNYLTTDEDSESQFKARVQEHLKVLNKFLLQKERLESEMSPKAQAELV